MTDPYGQWEDLLENISRGSSPLKWPLRWDADTKAWYCLCMRYSHDGSCRHVNKLRRVVNIKPRKEFL